MRIDSLKTTPDRAGRYWVVFDDGSKLGLYRQTVEDFGLYTGRELSQEDMNALREAAGKMSARMRAVRIVSMSSVSRKDLQDRLIHKELHLVDDRATAESVVRSCAAKGYGAARAKQALYEKRIPKELWDEALKDYPDQTEKIEAFLRGRLSGGADDKQVKRAIDALIRRGHSYGDIRRVLEKLSLETDDILEE